MSNRPERAIGRPAEPSRVPARAAADGPDLGEPGPAARPTTPARRVSAALAAAGMCAILALAATITLRGGVLSSGSGADPGPRMVGTVIEAPLPGDPIQLQPAPVTPDTMAPGTVLIPDLGVYAGWTAVSIAGGEMPVPADPALLGLNERGGQPCGGAGTILMTGHIAVRGVQGALWPLAATGPGTTAWLRCADGERQRFTADTPVAVTPQGEIPLDVDDPAGPLRLVLVTCGGSVRDGHYADNIVATFEEVPL